MASRQALWQAANVAMGLCRQCGSEAIEGTMCQDCSDKSRIASREYSRRKRGIPLDAPLWAKSKTVKAEVE